MMTNELAQHKNAILHQHISHSRMVSNNLLRTFARVEILVVVVTMLSTPTNVLKQAAFKEQVKNKQFHSNCSKHS